MQKLFDFASVAADKPSYLTYFKEAERLARQGGTIIADNIVRYGTTAYTEIEGGIDQNLDGVRRLLRYVRGSDKVKASTIATVGSEGHEGFLHALRSN